jgi:hypothetical protein
VQTRCKTGEGHDSLQSDTPWLPQYRCDCGLLPFSFFFGLLIFSVQPEWILDVFQVESAFSARSHSDTWKEPNWWVCEWAPLPEPFFNQHILTKETHCLQCFPNRLPPNAAGSDPQTSWLRNQSYHRPSYCVCKEYHLGSLEASWSPDELISTWIPHSNESTPIPGLACLTNAALKPKTPKLLPHVLKDPELQAISTTSVRLERDNQENQGLKSLF